jgi:hypothetical protein
LDVNYWRDIPADTEFPHHLARMDLFTRFYLDQAKATAFRVQVSWLDHPGESSVVVGDYGPFQVDFWPDESVRDVAFRLPVIPLQGAGRHSIELLREYRSGWRAGELVPIAVTHFLVER